MSFFHPPPQCFGMVTIINKSVYVVMFYPDINIKPHCITIFNIFFSHFLFKNTIKTTKKKFMCKPNVAGFERP